MNYEELMNSDLLKLFYCLGTDEQKKYRDTLFDSLEKIARKEIPAEEIGKGVYEPVYKEDDAWGNGISFRDQATVWFDDCVVDECEDGSYEYAEEASGPVAIDVYKEGCEILSPEIAIGKPLTQEDVVKILDGNFSGAIGTHAFGDTALITASLRNFELQFWTRNGILASASILAVSLPETNG